MRQSTKLLLVLGLATLTLGARLFAAAGDLYVSSIDEGTPANGEVLRISLDGTPHHFASPIGDPYGVVFDRNRQLLVASDPANAIYRYTPDASRTTFASNVNGPIGMAYDSSGNLYVAAIRSNSIIRFASNGTQTTFASTIATPLGIGVDAAGNVYTSSLTSGSIIKVTPSGSKSTFASGLSGRTCGIVFDRDGNLLLAERDEGVVSKFTPQGARSVLFSGFVSPFGLLFDREGNLLVSEHDAGRIVKITPEGVRTIFASGLRSPAFMAIEPAAGAPVNISSRLQAGTGQDVLIAGFIVTGTQAKRVIARAIGPSLTLPGPLPDPYLELRGASGLIAANDNWRTNQESEITATLIPPSHDLESAIVATLPANGATYTAVVRGANDETGTGVVEVYDLETSADSRLANVSTRGLVQNGDNLLIGGFIVNQNGARVVARALGPSLQQFGVTNALPDPALTVFNSNGTAVATCNNWRDSQEFAIQQTGLAPQNDMEAVVVTTLANGGYTAVVSGQGGLTGVGLVEIYSVP